MSNHQSSSSSAPSAPPPPTSTTYKTTKERIKLLENIQNYLTSKYVVYNGRDTNDIEYDSIVEFWSQRGLLVMEDDDDGDDDDHNDEQQPKKDNNLQGKRVENKEEDNDDNDDYNTNGHGHHHHHHDDDVIATTQNDYEKWYQKSHDYWNNDHKQKQQQQQQQQQPSCTTTATATATSTNDDLVVQPTIDGMLGGFAILSDSDLASSKEFLKSLFDYRLLQRKQKQQQQKDLISSENHDNHDHDQNNIRRRKRSTYKSCECGAGIGRITKGLMIPLGITQCDLVETSIRLLQHAPTYIGTPPYNEKDFKLIHCGLENFNPSKKRYNVIWIQWCIGYLTDWDLVLFLRRMGDALKDGSADDDNDKNGGESGVIVIKDNICNDMAFLADCVDCDITRSYQYLLGIIKESGLRVVTRNKDVMFANDENQRKDNERSDTTTSSKKDELFVKWQDDFPDDIWPVPMIALEKDV